MTYNDYINPHIQGLIGDDGVQWLYEQAAQMRNVVEVGCWYGCSTHALCSACDGIVFAVDHWMGSPATDDATHDRAKTEDVFGGFCKNVGHFRNLHILKMPSVEAARFFRDASVDMIVIDAGHDHASVNGDVAAWLPKCRKLFCGHDWSHGPVRAAIERLGRPVSNHPSDMWSIRCDG